MSVVELTVGGVALVPIIVALCELAKRAGLADKYVPILNAALSLAGYTLVVVITQKPEVLQPAMIVLNGLLVMLSAVGAYRAVKTGVKWSKANLEYRG